MALFRAACLFAFLSHCVSRGMGDPFPVTFGSPGDNVTIYSDSRVISRSFLYACWYRLRQDGGVEHKAYFSSYSSQYGRFRGKLPENSSNVSLTILNVTKEDSGQYFPVVLESFNCTPGTIAVLAVTDQKDTPDLRMFVSHKPNSRVDVLCELRGPGPDWTDPELNIGDMLEVPAQINVGSALDDSGVFTRISILSVALNGGSVTVNCMSHSQMTTIRKSITIQQNDVTFTWLMYLSPVCILLVLATIICAVQVCRRN